MLNQRKPFHDCGLDLITHWGRIAVDCGTPLSGGLHACRPTIPVPGSADWRSSPSPDLWAWRSSSGADWPPKHTTRADKQRWGPNPVKSPGCVPVLSGKVGMPEHICHTFVAFLVLRWSSLFLYACLIRLCWSTPSREVDVRAQFTLHAHTPIPHTRNL